MHIKFNNYSIFKFDVFLNLLKSITIDFTFQTKNQTLLWELSLIDEENVKWLSINNILKIESIVSYERSYYLITATDSFAIDLHYYLVSHSQNIASRFIFDLKSEQKLNVIKSGGIYNSINNILYKVEQLEYSYLINFDIYHNITLSKTFMFKSEFDQCQYTGYSEFYSTILLKIY